MATSTNGSSTRTTERWTAARVRKLPDDGKRYEVIAGVLLVTPPPAEFHQSVSGRLYWSLRTYLMGIGQEDTLFNAPCEISWDKETLVQPDLFVGHPEEVGKGWKAKHRLLLAIEIISPSSVRTDRSLKRKLYQRNGVCEYWVVDPREAKVEVWHPNSDSPTVETKTLVWQPDPALASPAHPTPEPLTLDLKELFRPLGTRAP